MFARLDRTMSIYIKAEIRLIPLSVRKFCRVVWYVRGKQRLSGWWLRLNKPVPVTSSFHIRPGNLKVAQVFLHRHHGNK